MSDTTTEVLDRIAAYIGHQRWFAGKGRDFGVTDVRTLAWLPGDEVTVQLALVEVASDGGVEVYQVPLSHRDEWADGLEHAHITEVDGRHMYDAMHDSAAVELITLSLTSADADMTGSLRAHRVVPRELERGQASVLLTGEQSNSNVRVGDDLLLKLFRRVSVGHNPDIEVLAALTETGSAEIVPLVGWLDSTDDDGVLDLAMLSDFLRTASDGWDLALTSVRDLFAERDLHPDEVGGDFAAESHRLGVTAARLHADLAAALPRDTWSGAQITAVTERMRGRLTAAAEQVPEVAEHTAALAGAFDAMDKLSGGVAVQRLHGDFHLGQTLRTMDGWRVIDFEGEPATPLTERTELDCPLRDVAGMLRSFDYAAQSQWADLLGDHQLAQRAREWAERNRAAFLDGYAEDSGADLTGSAAVLLRAYETDKAVYEAVYEVRNRPTWLPIPLRAISRLAHDTGGAS